MKIIKNFGTLHDFYNLIDEGDILNYQNYHLTKTTKYFCIKKLKFRNSEIELVVLVKSNLKEKSNNVLRRAHFNLMHARRTEIIKP